MEIQFSPDSYSMVFNNVKALMRAHCKCMGGRVQSALWSLWYRWNSTSISDIKPSQKLLKVREDAPWHDTVWKTLLSTSGIYSLQWKLEWQRDFFTLPVWSNPRFVWEQNSVKMLFPSSSFTESTNVVSFMYPDLTAKNNSFLKEGSQAHECLAEMASILQPSFTHTVSSDVTQKSESHPAISVVSFQTIFV